MGYHKQELVRAQVEVGDRYPAKPAAAHIANTRRASLAAERAREAQERAMDNTWELVLAVSAGVLIGAGITVLVVLL